MENSISRKKNKNLKIIKKENILNLPKKKKIMEEREYYIGYDSSHMF